MGFTRKILLLSAATLSLLGIIAQSSSAQPNPTRISLWHYLSPELGGHALSGFVDEFNKSQNKYLIETKEIGSNVDVNIKIVAALRNNDLPVAALVDNIFFNRLALGGQLADLNDLMTTLPKTTEDDFYPILWEYGKVKTNDNKMHRLGLPWVASTLILYYNQDAFKAKNINPPKTWEDFAKVAKALTTRAAKGALFVTDGWVFVSAVTSRGASVITPDGKPDFANPNAVSTLRIFYDLARAGYLIPRSFGEANFAVADFLRTKAFMVVSPTSIYPVAFKQSIAFEVGATPLPGKTVAGESQMAIFKNATPDQQRGMFEFWQYVTRADNMAKFARESYHLPARKSAAKIIADFLNKDPVMKAGMTALEDAFNPPHVPEFQTWRLNLEAQLERSLKGGLDPQKALEEVQRQALSK